MKAVVISDSDYRPPLFTQLRDELLSYLSDFEIEEFCVGRNELAYCTGCFGCWIKTPGECVIKDRMAGINRACINADAVFYLSPVVFGQCSANIKAAIDRWLPNMLPFFIVRPDGSTMHPPRYAHYPSQFIIGYGEDISAEDTRLFLDITQKHRRSVKTFVYNPSSGLRSQLGDAGPERIEGLL